MKERLLGLAVAAIFLLAIGLYLWSGRPEYACTDDPGDDIPACRHDYQPQRSPVYFPVPNEEYCRSIGGVPKGPDVCARYEPVYP
jgi:ABC-type cobalt transport system substrate-binding protein